MTKLTDERLLSMAAKALGYASIDPERGAEEGPGSFRQALEVFPEELIAFARAVLAAEPPAPMPADHVPDAGNMVAADEEREEREELAGWLQFEADNVQELGCATIYDHDRLRWAADYLRQSAPAPADLTPVAYDAKAGTRIELTRSTPCQLWAVRSGAYRMSIHSEWSAEPMPSSRTADYLAMHSFPSPAAAWAELQRYRKAVASFDGPQPPPANTTHPTPTEPPTDG